MIWRWLSRLIAFYLGPQEVDPTSDDWPDGDDTVHQEDHRGLSG